MVATTHAGNRQGNVSISIRMTYFYDFGHNSGAVMHILYFYMNGHIEVFRGISWTQNHWKLIVS